MNDLYELQRRLEKLLSADLFDMEELVTAHTNRGYLLCAIKYGTSLTKEDYSDMVTLITRWEQDNVYIQEV